MVVVIVYPQKPCTLFGPGSASSEATSFSVMKGIFKFLTPAI